MSIEHGIRVLESSTVMSVPKTAGTIQVVIGTAPVHMVADPDAVTNKPIYCASINEAMQMLGYCSAFDRYTLCQSMYANSNIVQIKPIILINVLDVHRHSKALTETAVTVETLEAKIPMDGILKDDLTVKIPGEGSAEAITLIEGVDYNVQYDTDGSMIINLIPGGSGDAAKTLLVSGRQLDTSLVTAQDVIGEYNVTTGAETGMNCIRQIYPKFGVVPTLLLAPGFSHIPEVAIALAAKADRINGAFRAMAITDLDTEKCKVYTDGKTVKEESGLVSEFSFPVWPYATVGDTMRFAPSAIVAAGMADLDADNGDIPYESPSNKPIGITGTCLADGTEVLLDQDQANLLNSAGIMTFINVNGFRPWGNYTAAYPSSGDPKDIWIPVRRMFNWVANSFILTFMHKVDDPMNVKLIEDVVNTANNQYKAMAPTAWAGASVEYRADDNPTTDIIAGKITFRIHIAPYTPAQDIVAITDYDIQTLTDVLHGAAA